MVILTVVILTFVVTIAWLKARARKKGSGSEPDVKKSDKES